MDKDQMYGYDSNKQNHQSINCEVSTPIQYNTDGGCSYLGAYV